jgi:hypothetical protein
VNEGAYVVVPVCDGVVGCALDGLERGFGDEADEAFYYAVDFGGVFWVVELILSLCWW